MPDGDWKARYLVELRWIAGTFGDLDKTEDALRHGMDGGYFSAHLSKLKKILQRELGPAAAPYLISDGGSRPRRYRLALRPAAVWYGALEATTGTRSAATTIPPAPAASRQPAPIDVTIDPIPPGA